MKLYQTRRVQGTRRNVTAIKLSDSYKQYNAENKLVSIWSGDDGKAYEARTIRGKQVFVPFRTWDCCFEMAA